MRKKCVSLLLVLSMLVVSIVGCGGGGSSGGVSGDETVSFTQTADQGMSDDEIITTTPVDQEKMMITVRVENGVGQQDNFEKILEEKFPNVDIVLRHDGSANSVYTMRANLESAQECDLLLSRTLPFTADVASEYLLDLSSESFVDNYYMNAVDSCTTSDGELYYLPGPSDVYGIVYDKTMFDEYGWELPHSYSEFVALLDTIRQTTKEAGEEVDPFTVSLMYPDMMQILFNTYSYDDVYSGTDNFLWLGAYQEGEGSMVGHMEQAVKDFKQLFKDGVLSLDATTTEPSERSEKMYVDHSTAMIIECQNAVNYVKSMTEGQDTEIHDLAMMPFWTSDEKDSDYLYAIPEYYLAISKRAASQSAEKKEILLEIMDYLSSVEGQTMLMGDDFVLSNIEGVDMNANSFSENIIDTVERGQVINTFYLAAGENSKQVERAMLALVPDLINDKISVKDFLTAADEARDAWLAGSTDETSYGTVETTLTRLETAYTMAEMYADVMGTSIGICQGGNWNRSTNGYLYEGSVTDGMLEVLTPNKEAQADETNPNGDSIVTAELTGQQILDVLNAAPEVTDTKGLSPYYVAYGLTVEFAPWAAGGERVISCKTSDGKEIDPEATYEVAYFNGSLPLEGIELSQVSEQEWVDAFTSWLAVQGGTIKKPEMTLTLVYDEN